MEATYAPGQPRASTGGQRPLSPKRYRLLKITQEIRQRYPDGEPLSQQDRDFMLGLLRCHPRAQEKFGAGITDIVAHPFIGGSRCFFVIRADGSAEDFSVRKCLGQELQRSQRVALMMASFRYALVTSRYRRARAESAGRSHA